MPETGFYNGKFLPTDSPCVQMEDRGHQFGDGIYEVTRFYDGKLFAFDKHLSRLRRSLKELELGCPYSDEEIAGLHQELIKRSGIENGTVYMQITRGSAPRAHPFPDAAVNVAMNVRKFDAGLEAQQKGIAVIFTEDIRWLRCDIKSLNLLGNVLAKQAAHIAGAAEAIQYRRDTGHVTEGSSSNFFVVKDDALHTHPLSNLILNGVTRTLVLEECAPKLGIEVIEEPFSTEYALSADEAFATSTGLEVTPVISIDGQAIGNGQPGPITNQLLAAYQKLVSST